MKTVEERLKSIEWELEQIKKVFLIQLEQAKIDQELFRTNLDCLEIISKKLGVETGAINEQ